MGIRKGRFAKLYLAQGGVGVGAWTEVGAIGDAEVTLEAGTFEYDDRESGGWSVELKTARKLSVSFKLTDKGAANAALVDMLQTAAFADDDVTGVKALPAAGGQGPIFNATVKKFSPSGPLDGAVAYDVEMALTESDSPPSWGS